MGSKTRERRRVCPRNEPRARTIAIGTPKMMHRSVDTLAVCRLRMRAVRDEGLVMRDQKLLHSILVPIAMRGTKMNAPPMTAGT